MSDQIESEVSRVVCQLPLDISRAVRLLAEREIRTVNNMVTVLVHEALTARQEEVVR